ncbi:MAG: enzyme of heme biosynthesis [Rikenellaceae bacterium]
MKKIKLTLIAILSVIALSTQAQQMDFSDDRKFGKYGATPEERKENMLKLQYFREAIETKNYEKAAAYLHELLKSAPQASETMYQRAANLYKAQIARAATPSAKRAMVDSLMWVYDVRLEHFSEHPQRGRAYILENKAREFYQFSKSDREGMREVFIAAIDANPAIDPTLVLLYFTNILEDYNMDIVTIDEVIDEYDRFTPYFEGLTGEHAELNERFQNAFATSGVANCENIENIFKAKIEAAPTDAKLLTKALVMMERAGCRTPFYMATAEMNYQIAPTSQAAMILANDYQNRGEYDKAVKYLRDALAEEQDIEEQELLYSRIALIKMAANQMSEALTAARAALAIADGTDSDNGIAYFVLAQAIAASADSCPDFSGQTVYWAAYDTMNKAINNFSADEKSYVQPAKNLLNAYKKFFPTTEECFFNEIPKGSQYTITCGIAKGKTTIVRTRD